MSSAQYHALVLRKFRRVVRLANTSFIYVLFHISARIPFHSKVTASPSSQPAPSLGAEKGKLTLGVSKSGQVPSAHLRSLRDLLASPHASEVLSSLRTASRTAIQLLQDQMRRDHNDCVWPIRTGFHAIPSMETVHLHVRNPLFALLLCLVQPAHLSCARSSPPTLYRTDSSTKR